MNGVRESLENQVMQMAKSAAKFLTDNLQHPDGNKVECVIADSCIGGVAESAMTAEKFERENVGLSLTLTPCWCYGSETIDMNATIPKAIWGFNGTERPGAVYLALSLPGITKKGCRRLVFMAAMYRMLPTLLSLPMFRKSCCALQKQVWLWLPCVENHILSIGAVSMGFAVVL